MFGQAEHQKVKGQKVNHAIFASTGALRLIEDLANPGILPCLVSQFALLAELLSKLTH